MSQPLTGQVVDATTSEPVAEAEVQITIPAADEKLGTAETDEQGQFTMREFPVAAREYAAEQPHLEVTVRRDETLVETKHKPFDWNRYWNDDYEFRVDARRPTTEPDVDEPASDTNGHVSNTVPSHTFGGSGLFDHGIADAIAKPWVSGSANGENGEESATDFTLLDTGLEEIPTPCECRDCETAVSPAAYLAHLLRYSSEHVEEEVENSWEGITLGDLEDAFHQPFDRLPLDCETVTESVLQVRIATEVLLSYLDAHADENDLSLVDANDETLIHQETVDEYLETAYETLLSEWGTSLEELRTAGYEESVQESVSNRIGIHPDRVSADDGADIQLEPTAERIIGSATDPERNPEAVLATTLEERFGWSPVLTLDPETQTYQVEDPLETGDRPDIATWRRSYLEDQWFDRDHPSDAYTRFVEDDDTDALSVIQDGDKPAIDPDVIGRDDLRHPTDETAAPSLWEQRRRWIDAQLESLWALRPGVDEMVEAMFASFEYPIDGDTVAATWEQTDIKIPRATDDDDVTVTLDTDLDALVELKAHLENPDTSVSELETNIQDATGLGPEAFDRLASLVTAAVRVDDRLSDEQLWEVASLLVAARKSALKEDWILEERNEDPWTRNGEPVQLGPQEFWQSERLPTEDAWSTRRDHHANGGITQVTVGTVSTPDTPGAERVHVGFDPDLLVITASVHGASDELQDGRTGVHGWSHGAATLDDGSISQQAIWTGEDADGSSTAAGRDDVTLSIPFEDNDDTITMTGSVETAVSGGFELEFEAPDLDSDGTLPDIVVGYRAYQTADSAAVDIGHFETAETTGTQTTPLDIDADYVSLTTSNLVDTAGGSPQGTGPVAVSHGHVTAGDDPDQVVTASTFGAADTTMSVADDETAIRILFSDGDSLAGETIASVTSLDQALELDYTTVYDGQHNPGTASKFVSYVAIDAGDDLPGQETRPALGHFQTPSESETVEISTGFEPAAVEVTAMTTADALDEATLETTGTAGWVHGIATTAEQHGFTMAGHTATDAYASLQSSTDALPILYTDENGRVNGRETGRISLTDTGFTVDFPVTTTTADSTAPTDQLLVSYRVWPRGAQAEPYIDPERIDRSDLPEVTAGGRPRQLYEHRQKELDEKAAELTDVYESSDDNPIEAILDAVYGETLFEPSWDVVIEDIASALEIDAPEYRRRLTILELSTTAFETIRSAHQQAADGERPPEETLEDVVDILTTAWKRRERYPPTAEDGDDGWVKREREGSWITAIDDTADPDEYTLTDYWQAYRLSLPDWRSSQSARQSWQQALEQRSRGPVIDPDVINEHYIEATNDAALDVLSQRQSALAFDGQDPHPVLADLDGLDANSFEETLTAIVGIDSSGLKAIHRRIQDGGDIAGRLEQLDLGLEMLRTLVTIVDKLEEGHPVTDVEWENIRHIFVEIWKRRAYGRWRREEEAAGIYLDPDEFAEPDDEDNVSAVIAGADEEPLEWRLHRSAYRDWTDTLATRNEALDALDEQIDSAVTAAEEAAFPTFRDAMVDTVGELLQATIADDPSIVVSDAKVADPPRLVADRVLLDVQTEACRKTTRVSQATTSLQRLLERLNRRYADESGGPIDQSFHLNAETFESVWEWLGSYAKWRSALGVYLYPENVLLPTMRERRTDAFKQLERIVHAQDGLSPTTATNAVEQFKEYMDDVLSLTPDASCLTAIESPEDETSGPGFADEFETIHLGHAFSLGENAGEVYYRSYDPATQRTEPPGDRDGLWKPVPPLTEKSVDEIAGACSYDGSVYLFVQLADDRSEIGYVVLDVESDRDHWQRFEELSIPDDQTEDSDTDAQDDESDSEDNSSVDTLEVVTIEGESEPPEIFVQLENAEKDEQSHGWLEFVAYHGKFHTNGDPPEEYLPVRFDLYDTKYTSDGMVPSNEQPFSHTRTPPYHIEGVVRHTKEIELESRTNEIVTYHVVVEGEINYRIYNYVPENSFQPDFIPIAVLERSHHHRHMALIEGLNRERSSWEYRKEELEERSWSSLSYWEQIELRRLRSLVMVDDFTNKSQVELLIQRLDHLQESEGIPHVSEFTIRTPWLLEEDDDDDTMLITPRLLREHLIEGRWASHSYRGQVDAVCVDYDRAETYVVDLPNTPASFYQHGETRAHDLEIVDSDDSFHTETLGGPRSIPFGTQLSQTNNPRNVGGIGADKYLARPALLSAPSDWSQYNTHFGLTAFRSTTGNLLLEETASNTGTALLLGPVVPRRADQKLGDINGPWLNGVILPLDDEELNQEKSIQENRTQTMRQENFSKIRPRTRSVIPYIEEAYFYVPLLVGRHLTRGGHYEAALDWFESVYDYNQAEGSRKLYHYLRNGKDHYDFEPNIEWLTDPIRPHAIAHSRVDQYNPYTRFTQFSIIECLLEYADDEFTQDTQSSVARATDLYEDALEILDAPELAVYPDPCDEELSIDEGGEIDYPSLLLTGGSSSATMSRQGVLASIASHGDVTPISGQAELPPDQRDSDQPSEDSIERGASGADVVTTGAARETIEHATGQATGEVQPRSQSTSLTFEQIQAANRHNVVQKQILQHDRIATAFADIEFDIPRLDVDDDDDKTPPPPKSQGDDIDEGAKVEIPFEFCIPKNPLLAKLRTHAEANLEKIRTCRNIAGMKRELDPYGTDIGVESAMPSVAVGGAGGITDGQTASAVQPTDYRYSTLIQRTRELLEYARQIEGEYLHALEMTDQEEYQLRQARQGVELAEEEVRLQDLRIDRGHENVELAELERDRSHFKANHYAELLSAGLLDAEQEAKSSLERAITLQKIAFGFHYGAAGLHGITAAYNFISPTGSTSQGLSSLAALASSTASALSTQASMRSTQSQIYQMQAKYERREERWEFQRDLARKNVQIDSQKIAIARTDVDIARQQRTIAELEVEHARDMVNYLADEQFTNRELYQWMSGVLGRIYRYFLREATAMAKLAERQLAFQRQERHPGIIRSDYWYPQDNSGDDDEDRRGLTGSARLLQDVEKLDQYAFETDERTLTIEKTISLASLEPVALQQFRETGVVSFGTPMELFDRDYPGHYRRLIEDVNVSIVALTPPTEGINATLRTNGNSQVVIGDSIFRKQQIRRRPQSVSLDRAYTDTNQEVLLEPETNKRLRPFENSGVETEWELRMPKPANQFDYDTIADVLLTIEYSALESHTYGRQVKDRLGRSRVFDRTYSLRDDLADQWYELNNPETVDDPMTISFETQRDGFPPNIAEIGIDDIALYFVGPDDGDLEQVPVTLEFSQRGTSSAIGGKAHPVEGLISTPSASTWTSVLGNRPTGTWTLTLPDRPAVRRLFDDGTIEDILFVVSVDGIVPEWPGSN